MIVNVSLTSYDSFYCVTEFPLFLFIVLSSISESFLDLKSEYENLQIKSLCVRLEDDSYSLPHCYKIDPFIPLLIPFAIINSTEFINDIFACKWHGALNTMRGIVETEIPTNVWKPIFAECIQLMHNLEHEKLSIGDASFFFAGKEKSEIHQSIKRLLLGIKMCEHVSVLGLKNVAVHLNNQNPELHVDKITKTYLVETTPDWVHGITKKISEWCCVQSLCEMADTLMQILENFTSLPKEIEYLELFTSQVN